MVALTPLMSHADLISIVSPASILMREEFSLNWRGWPRNSIHLL